MPKDLPLRPIRRIADAALRALARPRAHRTLRRLGPRLDSAGEGVTRAADGFSANGAPTDASSLTENRDHMWERSNLPFLRPGPEPDEA